MLDPTHQSDVIRGLLAGSRDAWTALYDAYSTDIWRYVARSLGGDAAAVSDVVQETFLAAARSAHNFDPQRGTLWNWLCGIAHHQVTAHWRALSRVQRLRELAESQAAEIRHWFDGQADAFTYEARHDSDRRDLADLVRGVLAEMSADYVVLLTLKYLDGQTLEQIAVQQNMSPDATKSKLARARREFKNKFEFVAKRLAISD